MGTVYNTAVRPSESPLRPRPRKSPLSVWASSWISHKSAWKVFSAGTSTEPVSGAMVGGMSAAVAAAVAAGSWAWAREPGESN